MEATTKYKRAGRKPKAKKDLVVNKAVYLTNAEWALILAIFESPTDAMRQMVLPNCSKFLR